MSFEKGKENNEDGPNKGTVMIKDARDIHPLSLRLSQARSSTSEANFGLIAGFSPHCLTQTTFESLSSPETLPQFRQKRNILVG